MLSKKFSWTSDSIQEFCELQGKAALLAQARSALFKLPVTHLLSQSMMASAPLLHALVLQGTKIWGWIVDQWRGQQGQKCSDGDRDGSSTQNQHRRGMLDFGNLWEIIGTQNDLGWRGPQLSLDQVTQSIIQPDLTFLMMGHPKPLCSSVLLSL